MFAVAETGQSLDRVLPEHRATLDPQHHAFFQALCYGSLREYPAYKEELTKRLSKPLKAKDRVLYAVIITALYQLDEMDQADYAVINEAVKLSTTLKRPWAKGLINAILRNYLRETNRPGKQKGRNWEARCFPEWLQEKINADWPDHCQQIIHASQQSPPMSLRVNLARLPRAQYLDKLRQQGIEATACQDSAAGVTLKIPLVVDRLPGFAEGMVSVQDESAQLCAPLFTINSGCRILDACAAPGGKSLHLAEIAPQNSKLTVMDLPDRLPRLRENLERAKLTARVLEGDFLALSVEQAGGLFNVILLDVPCTGTGVMRRHPDIKLRRRPENTLQFVSTQRAMLDQAWRLLKPGGQLLYTTCSIFPEENEQNIAFFLSENQDAQAEELPEYTGLKTGHGRQRLQGVHSGDGFFYALMHRKTP